MGRSKQTANIANGPANSSDDQVDIETVEQAAKEGRR